MRCPNGHGGVTQTGTVSDGAFIRPVLSCGCCPTHDQMGQAPVLAALPSEPVQAPIVIDEQAPGMTHDEVRVQALIEAALAARGL